ncbi:MAG: phycobiliprotein lyase [Stenomitos frigidus ULC029]
MDIVEFFQLSSGKWFSQRSSHDLTLKQSESGKADFQVELLPNTDPVVIKLCEQHQLDPALALCGVRVSGDSSTAWDKEEHTGISVLVPIADPNKPNEGKLLHETSNAKPSVAGRYVVGSDESVTLISEHEALYAEERLWFASQNLRLRTSLLKRADGFSMAAFYTEIRKGVASPPAETKA